MTDPRIALTAARVDASRSFMDLMSDPEWEHRATFLEFAADPSISHRAYHKIARQHGPVGTPTIVEWRKLHGYPR